MGSWLTDFLGPSFMHPRQPKPAPVFPKGSFVMRWGNAPGRVGPCGGRGLHVSARFVFERKDACYFSGKPRCKWECMEMPWVYMFIILLQF